jgi:hypothetical protein
LNILKTDLPEDPFDQDDGTKFVSTAGKSNKKEKRDDESDEEDRDDREYKWKIYRK